MRLRVRKLTELPNALGVIFSNGVETAESRGFMKETRPYLKLDMQEYHFYLVDGFGMAYSHGAYYSLAEYRRKPGDDYLCFGGNNLLLLDIEMRGITIDEVPEQLRNPRARVADQAGGRWVPRSKLSHFGPTAPAP